jgi:ABC-type multidrug transport system fused ATPase/permease subunit
VRQNNSAELSRRVNLISLNFVVGFLRPIAVIAGEVVLLGLILVALAIYDIGALCVVVLIFAPAICGYYYFVRRRLNQYGREENEAHNVRFRSVAESFRGYADVEVNNAFPRMLSIYDQYTMRLSSVQKRDAMLSAMPQSFMELAITLGMALLVVTGVFLPEANVKIVFGVFAVAAIRLMPSVRTILSAYSSMSHNKYTLEILSDTSDRVDAIEESKRKNLKSQIDLHNVCFSYQDEPVIKDFNLIIKRGDRVGIQGSSGRGKSTLMNLLVGLLSPDSGEILIDGELLTKENSRLWQNSIGYVSQSVFLLDSTLKENIAFGVEPNKIDMDRLRDVISLASLDEFVKTLPDGVDSNIGEGGCRISGGERQRIGIARALYRKADVLLLDEATSSLDSNTQSQINEAIKKLSQKNPELTIVVIAHRASALDYCDYIVNM